jgi:myo-inositol 2-dehydrogenase/D-chiro-inositol 1-dehydrogenase
MGSIHARSVAALPDVAGVTIFDTDPAAAERLAATITSVPTASVSTLEDAVTAGPDAVVIATPSALHAEHVEWALRAGLPAMCEKPIALDLQVIDQLIKLEDESPTTVMVGFQRRVDPTFRQLKAAIDGGQLGQVLMVRTVAFDHEPPPLSYIPLSGGIYADLVIHDFDAVRWLVGDEVVEVDAIGAALVDPALVELGDVDTTVVTMRFANGTLAVISASRNDGLGYDHRVEILGTRDSIAAGLDARTPLTTTGPDALVPQGVAYNGFIDRFAVAYDAEGGAFVDLLLGRGANPCTLRDARAAQAIAIAAAESLSSGQRVQLGAVNA